LLAGYSRITIGPVVLASSTMTRFFSTSVLPFSDGQDRFCEPYSRGLNRIRVIADNPFDPRWPDRTPHQ